MRKTRNSLGSIGAALFTLLVPTILVTIAPVSAQNMQGGSKSGGNGVGSEFELVFWQSVAGSDDRDQLTAYLSQYPNGTFSALARAKIAGLDRRTSGTAAPVMVSAVTTSHVAAAPLPAAPAPPAPVQAALPAAVPVQMVAAPLPAPAATQPVSPATVPSLSQQLHLLSAGQGLKAPGSAAASRAAIPAAPALQSVPAVTLPDHFCSAVARNAFYDDSYRPVVDIADRNNQAAIAYLEALQALYNDLSQRSEIDAMNAVAVQSQSYKPTASQAYQQRAAFEDTYTQMMAVPIQVCAGEKK
jgi:hypothetical protein